MTSVSMTMVVVLEREQTARKRTITSALETITRVLVVVVVSLVGVPQQQDDVFQRRETEDGQSRILHH